ncbi:hypothetical protein H2200_010026 [Cladophialophora chaetospira]|uniref:Carboxylesterase family protein n=1 Tax=Cladophialophora chaetospira TaxID=386627 RepID=A0AA38X217_9EURO|nr:hypothetical protein H2200_010026 [Cladophialophora chaetospira]
MRVTRAAVRAQAHDNPQLIHEDADADSFHTSTESDANQDLSRTPLKDITTEANPAVNEDPFADEAAAPTKKAKGKKKGKLAKKGSLEEEPVEGELQVAQEPTEQVTDNSSLPQSSDESLESRTLSQGTSSENQLPHEQSSLEAVEPPVEDIELSALTSTPQPIPVDAPKTPKFNPSVHKPVEGLATPAVDTVEDSFIEKITSRTPGRMVSFQEENKSPDSFVEQMSSRTPRIEDSVEAIDALEDAIEKVAETLPALEDLKMESPVKSRKTSPARLNVASKAPTSSKKPIPSPARSQRVSPAKTRPVTKAVDRPKPTVARQSSVKTTVKPGVATNPVKKPVIDGHKARQSSAQAAPPLSFSNSPAKNLPNTTQKRVPSATLSTSRPAFIPAKSTKPPTKSTFQLPGEALSAKLKAEREERLKREQEAEKEKKTFKARPVPTKVARPSVVPRENKASQARMSIYANGVDKENVAPKPTIAAPPKPRPSSLDAKSKSSELATRKANSSVRRTTTTAIAPKPRISSLNLTTGQKLAVTKDDAVQQKAKGKEVFGRTKAQLEQAEKERREKEAATRKARAEAAERGRQASREWAEKQKQKIQDKLLSVKEKGNGDFLAKRAKFSPRPPTPPLKHQQSPGEMAAAS